MPQFNITPAFDENVLCVFTIPRKGAKPIEFSVVRMEYTSIDGNDKFDQWLRERGQPVKKVAEDGTETTEAASIITDREVTLKMLECAGVSRTKLDQLDKLTNGELQQIWNYWNDASKVTPGESGASEDS